MVNPVHLLTYRFSQGWSKALDNFYSLLKQNIKSCNAKRRRQRERWKNNSRYNKQKINFARAAPFFLYISSPLFWMTATWNFQKLPSYKFYGRNVGRVLFSFFFFSLSLIFTLVAASIPQQQNFILFLQQKMSSFVFFSLALALPPRLHTQIVWASCGHINLCRGKRSFKAFQIERDLVGQRIERGKTNM